MAAWLSTTERRLSSTLVAMGGPPSSQSTEAHGDLAWDGPAYWGPWRVPGLGVDLLALVADQVGEDVQVVHGRLHQQRVGDLVPEHARAPEGAAVAGRAEDDVVDAAVAARPQLLLEGRLVLVEAVAHGDAHLATVPSDLVRDPDRGFHAVGDRLLREDVEAVLHG